MSNNRYHFKCSLELHVIFVGEPFKTWLFHIVLPVAGATFLVILVVGLVFGVKACKSKKKIGELIIHAMVVLKIKEA